MGTAGIILNARVGDRAYGWAADHVEPAVSIRNREDGPEHALHYLACIGNPAVVTSGEAKGARGVVTGEHAHIMVDFEPEVLEKICIGDQILIRALGMGLELLDYPDIYVRKISPESARRPADRGVRRRPHPPAGRGRDPRLPDGLRRGARRRLRRPGHDDQRPRDPGLAWPGRPAHRRHPGRQGPRPHLSTAATAKAPSPSA